MHYSFLSANLDCPECGKQVSDLVWFQWGFSPGRILIPEYQYRIGDRIRWQDTRDGATLPWAYFYKREGNTVTSQGANLGDPAIRNLLVRDAAQFWWQHPDERRRCTSCGAVLEGAIVDIRDGVIQGARIYAPGEFCNDVEIFILGPGGILKPMPEWYDYPMGFVYDLLASA